VCGDEREELRRQGNSGRCDNGTSKCDRGYDNKGSDSNDRIRRSVTGSHRTIVLSWHTYAVAIALVLLEIAHLAMMYGAIKRIAAGRQIGGRKRFRQHGNAGQNQRQKGCDRCESADCFTQFGGVLSASAYSRSITRRNWDAQAVSKGSPTVASGLDTWRIARQYSGHGTFLLNF
jgi:hypothetical protein